MICPVTVKTAMTLQRDVLKTMHVAQEEGLLAEAISIMLEYISVPLIMDMLSDIQDMIADPSTTPLAELKPEEFNEFWGNCKASPKAGKEGTK